MRLPTAPLVRSALAFFRPALALSERGTDLIQLPPESSQAVFFSTFGFFLHFLYHLHLGLEERLWDGLSHADASGFNTLVRSTTSPVDQSEAFEVKREHVSRFPRRRPCK